MLEIILSKFGQCLNSLEQFWIDLGTLETHSPKLLDGVGPERNFRDAPSSNRPASPRSGRARAEAMYTIIYSGSVDVLVALALLLLVLAPQAIYTLALLMIGLLLPLLCCFCSWCWRSCSCPSCCSRYSCVACSAWGSLTSRASRSMIARFRKPPWGLHASSFYAKLGP